LVKGDQYLLKMNYTQECFDELVYNVDYGKEQILKEEFEKAIPNFKSEMRFLIFLYGRELRKEDFEDVDLGFKFNNFDTYRKRLKDKNYIRVSKIDDKKDYLIITNIGIEKLRKYIKNEFIEINPYIIENIREARKSKEELNLDKEENLISLIKEVFGYLKDKPEVHRAIQKGCFEFDLDEIAELDPIVLDSILDNFEPTLEIFKNVLSDHIVDEREYFEKIKDNIRFKNLEKYKSQIYRIHNIPKQCSEFIAVKGLLTKKHSKLKDEVYKIQYLCSNLSCTYSQDRIISPGNILKNCPRCKSDVEEVDRNMKSCLNLELSDLESESSLSVKAYDFLKDELSKVKVGEELTIYGYINYIKDKSYTKEMDDRTAYDRVLVVNNFYENNKIFSLKEDEIKEIEITLKKLQEQDKTIEEFLLEPFRNQFPYPHELNRMSLIPQFQNYNETEDIIHNLFVGSSGCGKSTYLRNMSKIFPKSEIIELKQLSEAKFYGGVKNDKITDLGICMKQREGSLILDECCKDEDSYFKGSHMLNEVLGSQTATKEKIGVSIKLTNVNLRVMAIMNPDPNKSLDTMQWVNKNFHESTVNRFFIINFDYFVDKNIENQIDKNYFEGNLHNVNNFDFEIRKKLIIYLRNINVDCSNIINDLINFQRNFKNMPLYYRESTIRNIRHLKNIVIGICKMKQKHFAEQEDLREAIELLVWTLKTKGEDLSPLIEPSAETVDMQTKF